MLPIVFNHKLPYSSSSWSMKVLITGFSSAELPLFSCSNMELNSPAKLLIILLSCLSSGSIESVVTSGVKVTLDGKSTLTEPRGALFTNTPSSISRTTALTSCAEAFDNVSSLFLPTLVLNIVPVQFS